MLLLQVPLPTSAVVNMWAMMWGTKRPTPGEVDCDCLFPFLSIFIFLLLFVFDPPELSCSLENEFVSLFLHEFKTAESWNSLIVANLELRKQPWVAIFCKTPPNPLNKEATREHEQEMVKVV